MAGHGQVKGGGPRERGRPSNLATGADARGPTDPEQLQITERGIKRQPGASSPSEGQATYLGWVAWL